MQNFYDMINNSEERQIFFGLILNIANIDNHSINVSVKVILDDGRKLNIMHELKTEHNIEEGDFVFVNMHSKVKKDAPPSIIKRDYPVNLNLKSKALFSWHNDLYFGIKGSHIYYKYRDCWNNYEESQELRGFLVEIFIDYCSSFDIFDEIITKVRELQSRLSIFSIYDELQKIRVYNCSSVLTCPGKDFDKYHIEKHVAYLGSDYYIANLMNKYTVPPEIIYRDNEFLYAVGEQQEAKDILKQTYDDEERNIRNHVFDDYNRRNHELYLIQHITETQNIWDTSLDLNMQSSKLWSNIKKNLS